MNIIDLTVQKDRVLRIDFNTYTEGDEDYKKKLISMLIVNILELQRAQLLADCQNSHVIFLNACHKMIFTLKILNDNDLNEVILQLKDTLLTPVETKKHAITLFNTVCDEIIRSLEKESLIPVIPYFEVSIQHPHKQAS